MHSFAHSVPGFHADANHKGCAQIVEVVQRTVFVTHVDPWGFTRRPNTLRRNTCNGLAVCARMNAMLRSRMAQVVALALGSGLALGLLNKMYRGRMAALVSKEALLGRIWVGSHDIKVQAVVRLHTLAAPKGVWSRIVESFTAGWVAKSAVINGVVQTGAALDGPS